MRGIRMIILDEIEYAKNILENGPNGKTPFHCASLLARYYRQILEYKPKKTELEIMDFLSKNFVEYSEARWYAPVESYIRKAKKRPLCQIPFVGITQKELDIIQSTENDKCAKVLFSLLCTAKYFNIRKDVNNNWSNLPAKDIFRMANVSTTIIKQDYIIHDLYVNGFVEFSKRVDSLNIRVPFIDTSDTYVLKISDFRNLGYAYLNWKSGGYFRCAECGVLCKQNRYGNKKYCNECAKQVQLKQIKEKYDPIITKNVICIDCGKEFTVKSKDNKTNRCPECYKTYRNDKNKEKYIKYNAKRNAKPPIQL